MTPRSWVVHFEAPLPGTLCPPGDIAIQLRAEYEDGGKTHQLDVELIDEDGRKLLAVAGQFTVGPIDPGVFSHNPQILGFKGVTFPREGRYRFNIRLNNDPAISVVLQVRQLKQG